MRSRYVVGVDGGGSKTSAIIADERGRVVGRGVSGSSNYHNVGEKNAALSIRNAVIAARSNAALKLGSLDYAVVALAAINSEADRRKALRFVRATKIARRIFVVHDSIAALHAVENWPAVIVISGTGCMAAGINERGEYRRVGGWGRIVDDEGSSYDIGRIALRAAFRSLDGRAPPTKLVSALKRRFRVRDLRDAMPRIYGTRFGVEQIASLTRLVSELSPTDGVSRRILKNAGIALGQLASHAVKQLGLSNQPVTITPVGGTFESGPHLLRSFASTIKRNCPSAKIAHDRTEPTVGSVKLALSLLKRHNPIDIPST